MRELQPVGVRRPTLMVSAVVMMLGGAGLSRRLPAQQGTGVRHLRGAGGQRLRAVLQHLPESHRQSGARGAGRPSVRRLGLDCLKCDRCSPKGTINDQVTAFAQMRDALTVTGRPIISRINLDRIHAETSPSRDRGGVANLWRTTECITSAGGRAEHPAERRLLFNQGSRTAIVGTTAGAMGKTGASFTPAHRTAVFPSAEAAPSHRHPT
jgi:hypothetical protein